MNNLQDRPHEPRFYLRADAYSEPLILNWYAWPYLLAPVSCAMHFTGRHYRLMRSFVANSHIHISASKEKSLVGGDFVNCSADQVEQVQALITQLEVDYADFFDVRKSITALNALLEKQQGHSLEKLYGDIPPNLRGYVELIYDMQHHADFRLIEGLLFEGDLYKPAAQSLAFGLLSDEGERPFVLSSPRLPDPHSLHFNTAFANPTIDRLFAARTQGLTHSELRALLAEMPAQGGLDAMALFTEAAPERRGQSRSTPMRIRYLGHAGLLIETDQLCVAIDPVIACRASGGEGGAPSFADLPDRLDYICITHTHMDHMCIETLLELRHKTGQVLVPKNSGGNIADPSMKLMLKSLGFSVQEFDEMEEITVGAMRIKAIPFLGEHADLNVRSKTAWCFTFQDFTVFCGADSSCIDPVLYERIARAVGKIDLLFLGMECVGAPMSWLYGALFTKPVARAINESRRFNGADFASAQRMIDIMRPTEVAIYAMGMEPWFKYFMGTDYDVNTHQIEQSDRLLAYCSAAGIHAERLYGSRQWDLECRATPA
ncbi:MBL fold metallo-hydrolase [Massilia rubra]|uniref:MBL fold metallo-hydrolase n=1 Tax=Massilia rubra TaxID=2607910 RepID=A0ABX0LLT8_9BURK|nr:MBL fold metallo-hydrolase [Massilia rubra]NHZ35816.1 MBL fold metallo-hydrolase [Massilia rubra]